MNTPTTTTTTPPATPMHVESTQPPVMSTNNENNNETSQPPVMPQDKTTKSPEAPVNYDDRIKRGMAEVVREVNNRAKAARAKAYNAFVQVATVEAKACANAKTYTDFAIHSDKTTRALEFMLSCFKSCLNDELSAKLALESLSNPKPVTMPEVLPFDIVGQTVGFESPRRHDGGFIDVRSKPLELNTSFRDSSQGSVFTTMVNQRKRRRPRHDNQSPIKATKKARANPLWTDKEKKQLRERVLKYAIYVLPNDPQVMTMLQLAERISRRLSKGKYLRSPTAVIKKIRNLGLVLTHPKDPALIAYLTTKNLMQYVPKRFQPTASNSDSDSTTTHKGMVVVSSPLTSPTDDSNSNCYTEAEIADAESTEPTTTTAALAALIASIPPVPITST